MTAKRQHISDLVGETYKTWHDEMILFNAGTGSGKTTFCTETLGRYAKSKGERVLYLCNRSELKKEVLETVERLGLGDIIRVQTYQSIQSILKNSGRVQAYDYIVADEAHYFSSDSTFNDYTQLSFDFILGLRKCVVILMSATAERLFSGLIRSGRVKEKNVFRIQKNYDFVTEILFYKGKELTVLLDEILAQDDETKALVFCNSAKRMIEMNGRYPKEGFFCSKSTRNSRLRTICGSGAIHDGSFDSRILFATTALDNGINITDRAVKYVFTELVDLDKLVQSLGRRRNQGDGDKVIFYVRDRNGADINRLLNIARADVEKADLCLEDRTAFFKKYGRDTRIARYRLFDFKKRSDDGNGDLVVNRMMYLKRKGDIAEYLRMMKVGFKQCVIEALGDSNLADRVDDVDVKVSEKDKLLEVLGTVQDIPIYFSSVEMERVLRQFENVAKLKYSKRPIHALNGILDDLYPKYPYRFTNKDCSGRRLRDQRRRLSEGEENPHYNKGYWILKRIAQSDSPASVIYGHGERDCNP